MKKENDKVKTSQGFLGILIIVLLFSTCSEDITLPQSMRLDLNVTLLDTTGFYEENFGTQQVDSATVLLSSISYQHYFDTLSNATGQAIFQAILPDVYNLSATKRVTVAQNGFTIEKVLNGQLQNLEVFGDECNLDMYIQPAVVGQLLISELYYNGSRPNPIPYYFHDQFLEIYNNSDSTLYLDSLIIADVDYGHVEEEFIHSVHAYMFPGSGSDYPLLPGEFAIVAQDAIDHAAYNQGSIDLTIADFEYYVKQSGSDVNNPDVENMIQLHHKYGIDWLYSVMNDAVVLLRVADPYAYGYDNFNQILLPKSGILDGLEYRDNLAEVEFKHLDASIDAGLTGGLPMYQGKSVERRIDFYKGGRIILMDNNNSSIDFQVLDSPTPGWIHQDEAE